MLQLPKILARSLRPVFYFRPFNLLNSSSFFFAESSRDIENRMRMERHKSINNQFKALKTKFGLNKPKQISADFPKPSTIEFTIESLRNYSNVYPEFLLKELRNQKSQFYEAIEKALRGFQSVDNKEAIEFLHFLVVWEVYLHDVLFQEVLIRKIYQMNLNLGEFFSILNFVVDIEKETTKTKITSHIQEKILQHVLNIDVHEYESLFKILNFMRVHDLSPKIKPETVKEMNKAQPRGKGEEAQEGEQMQKQQYNEDSFFKIVESVLLRDINNIPLPNIAEMVVHYANNIKEEYDDMINILTKTEPRIIENIRFFNHDELIAIMFSYLKTGTASEMLIEEFVRRVQLLYFEITWDNKKRIIQLASSLPYNKWIYVVGISIFEVLKGKKVVYRDGKTEVDPSAKEVQYQLLPTIYQAGYETNLATPELIDKIQSKILENIFNYSAEDLGLIAWLFTITPPSLQPKRENKNVLYVKLQSIIEGGFNGSTFTVKDISMVVWALCNTGGKSNSIYKENAAFWNNIEFYIQQRIGNNKEERVFNSCCQVMWAYGNNKPLTIKTVNMILDVVIEKESEGSLEEEMFVFELTTLTSFFNSIKDSLPPSFNKYIDTLSIKYFQLLVGEMNYFQIMKMLKYVIYDQEYNVKRDKLPQEVWLQILNQFDLDLDKIDYTSIMGVVGFTLVSPQGHRGDSTAVELVKRLMERKAKLQQVRTTESSKQ